MSDYIPKLEEFYGPTGEPMVKAVDARKELARMQSEIFRLQDEVRDLCIRLRKMEGTNHV